MKNTLILYSILLCIFNLNKVKAQGCSDAGACSIQVLSSSASTESIEQKNLVALGVNAGAGDYSIFVLTPYAGYTRKFGSAITLDTRLTYALINGNGVSNSGFGDLYLNVSHAFSPRISLSGGIKIPLGFNTYLDPQITIPMEYQPNLGTLDLITGLAYRNDKWMLGIGFQIPLTQNNNLFDPDDWDESSPLHQIPGQVQFNRKSDLLLRLARSIEMNDKMTLVAGLLPIYHLGTDQTRNHNNVFEDIEGSDGLTLNATLLLNLKVREKNYFNFNIGFPFIVRDARPDGLTRSFVAGVEYGIRF